MTQTAEKKAAILAAAAAAEAGDGAAAVGNSADPGKPHMPDRPAKPDKGSSQKLAMLAAAAAWDKKAADIVVQDVSLPLVITDYFVIVSGANPRQVDAIQDAVEEALREQASVKPIGREGADERTWVLLDYGDIVVHIFQPQTREFYRLENIWSDAPFADLSAAGIEQDPYPEWLARVAN